MQIFGVQMDAFPMAMCLGASAGSHEMGEMTAQTCHVDEELGCAGMKAVRGTMGS